MDEAAYAMASGGTAFPVATPLRITVTPSTTTVAPAGKLATVRVKLSLALPVFCSVLVKLIAPLAAFVTPPGAIPAIPTLTLLLV